MNLLCDESVDRQIVEQLRSDGHAVLAAVEMSSGVSDDEVLTAANAGTAVLITGDKDFGEMVYRQGSAAHGVVLIRLAGLTPDRKAAVVSEVIRDYGPEMIGRFSVVSPGMVRIRKMR